MKIFASPIARIVRDSLDCISVLEVAMPQDKGERKTYVFLPPLARIEQTCLWLSQCSNTRDVPKGGWAGPEE